MDEPRTEGAWRSARGQPRPKQLPVAPIGAVEDFDYNNPHGHKASSTSIPEASPPEVYERVGRYGKDYMATRKVWAADDIGLGRCRACHSDHPRSQREPMERTGT